MRTHTSDMVECKPGSCRKAKLSPNNIKTKLEATLLKSISSHTKALNVSEATIRRNMKKVDGKSLVRVERLLLTKRIKETHLQHCQALQNNLKGVAPHCIIISDEKTWTVDPVRNHRNDCYLSFGSKINVSVRTLTMTKHWASIMSLSFVASNGIAVPHLFPDRL